MDDPGGRADPQVGVRGCQVKYPKEFKNVTMTVTSNGDPGVAEQLGLALAAHDMKSQIRDPLQGSR